MILVFNLVNNIIERNKKLDKAGFIEKLKFHIFKNHGNSQSQYANYLGVTKQMISHVVNGRVNPSKKILEDLGYKIEVEVKKTYTFKKVK